MKLYEIKPDCGLNSEEHVYAQRQSQYYGKVEECTICGHTKYGDPIVSWPFHRPMWATNTLKCTGTLTTRTPKSKWCSTAQLDYGPAGT